MNSLGHKSCKTANLLAIVLEVKKNSTKAFFERPLKLLVSHGIEPSYKYL